MNCSNCGAASRVFNTAKNKSQVYRERVCDNCGNKWYTIECKGGSDIGSIINSIKEAIRNERRSCSAKKN